ncbi:hypothetical protein ASF61_06035 [Duganella sp. Leaf126]|nr:hypothetical protein ASF61_06035 [Duganella sp. Leaf126]
MLHKSSGVALVTAIFLLVVLAGLGVAAVSLTTAQQGARVQDELGARAYQAARAGMEWALFTHLQGGGLSCASPMTFALPAGSSLSTFTATVTCAAAPGYGVSNGATDPTANRLTITVTACNGRPGEACPAPTNSADYIQRTIRAQL